jgi:hypothetical protein
MIYNLEMAGLTFLDLPGEIRNLIYYQLIVLPSLSVPKPLNDTPIYPEILHTCRKVHEEARQILYGCNTFFAHANLLTGLPRLRPNFSTISRPNLILMIRRYYIRVRLDCDPNFSAKEAQEAFTGVVELTLDVFQAEFGSSDYKVLKLFEGIRDVKKARIYGSITRFPEYANWLQVAMMTPQETEVPGFGEGETNDVRSYDIWTVSGKLTDFEDT